MELRAVSTPIRLMDSPLSYLRQAVAEEACELTSSISNYIIKSLLSYTPNVDND
jgi:hypothetical protein